MAQQSVDRRNCRGFGDPSEVRCMPSHIMFERICGSLTLACLIQIKMRDPWIISQYMHQVGLEQLTAWHQRSCTIDPTSVIWNMEHLLTGGH